MYLTGFSIQEVKNCEQAEQLESLLITLLTWGYDIISIDEFQNRVGYGNFSGKATCFAFPFGYKSIKDLVLPAFNRYKIPFSVALCSNYIGDQSRWEKKTKSMLSMEDIEDLKKSKLVSFGSSGITYKNITCLSEEEAQEELFKSKLFLEKFTNSEVNYFMWPYSQVPQNGSTLLKNNNYCAGFYEGKENLRLPFNSLHKIPLYPFKTPPSTLRMLLTLRQQERLKNQQ